MLTIIDNNEIVRPSTCNFGSLVEQEQLLPMHCYDKIILSYSGGKDSLAQVLQFMERDDVRHDQLELWHQHIDGAPGSRGLMDWPCTEGYVRATSTMLNIPLRFQWKDGGFEQEMLRNDCSTAGVYFEDENGVVQFARPQAPSKSCKCKEHTYKPAVWNENTRLWDVEETECPACGKGRRGVGTREKFPQVSADLSVRWCSSYLKIDVAKRAINNDPRFKDANILFVTGERREESSARAKYAEVDPHGSNTKKRRVDQWRSVIDWSEAEVWNIIKRHRIQPHPAYRLGWGRVSCMACIFGDKDQWASVKHIAQERFERIAAYEQRWGCTIKRGESVTALADKGEAFVKTAPDWLIKLAMTPAYPADEFFVQSDEDWQMPAGAFKRCGGPT